jgi:membrane glycosyltransferase
MQLATTFVTVVAGLVFSVLVAVVAEEFIFGQIFKIFFAPKEPASTHAGMSACFRS